MAVDETMNPAMDEEENLEEWCWEVEDDTFRRRS